MLTFILLAALWGATAMAVVNMAFQAVDLHTTSELIKRGFGKEKTSWMARHLNNAAVPWARRFWALFVVKLACVVFVAAPTVIAWYLPIVYAPAFAVIEAVLVWLYGKQMRLNWALYSDMNRRQIK